LTKLNGKLTLKKRRKFMPVKTYKNALIYNGFASNILKTIIKKDKMTITKKMKISFL
jgi:hypothetical protein